jgi:hypothetical protein
MASASNKPTTADLRKAIALGIRILGRTPTVRELRVGLDLPSDRAVHLLLDKIATKPGRRP